MPRALRENWLDYADAVRDLCIAAIAKRHTHRQYLRWLEEEIKRLAKTPRPKKLKPVQLLLAF